MTTRSLRSLYLDAFLVSGDARHADTARDILDYVLRDMTHPGGGFYSAEDADSEGRRENFTAGRGTSFPGCSRRRNSTSPRKYFGITAAGQFH